MNPTPGLKRWKVTSAPAAEPVSLTEMKAWLKVDTTADDPLITSLIQAGREWVEEYTNEALYTRTIQEVFDTWPPRERVNNPTGEIWLSVGPVQSITSIAYTDENGSAQTWAASNYVADLSNSPARIALKYDASWPLLRGEIAPITVTYVAGYGTSAIPEKYKTAIKMTVADWYENRQDAARTMTTAVQRLLNIGRVKYY